jgi:uncharacterized repeat protein (TIGR03803 family)
MPPSAQASGQVGRSFNGGIAPPSFYQVLHRFGGTPDGSHPQGNLLDLNGRLYGTTSIGGSTGGGTVYSTSPTGKGRVLCEFKAGTDGVIPYVGLLDENGTLYGTTT